MQMSNQRLLDRSAYSATTMSTYELLASYVVDVYYNHLYVEAIKMKNDSTNPVTSITEGYKHCVLAFLSAIDNKSKTYKARHYSQLLTGINEYFATWTSFATLTLADCVSKIVVEFVPSDYFESLNKDQLRNILRMVLTSSIREFSKVVIVNHLNGIIDNHKEPANIAVLKERMVDILIMEREGFYNKFLNQSAGKKTQTVDKNIAVKMQNEIKHLIKENKELKKRLEKAEKENVARVDQVKQVVHKYKLFVSKYKGLAEQHQRLQETTQEPSEYGYESEVHHYNPPSNYVAAPVPTREPTREPTRKHMSPPQQSSFVDSPVHGGDDEDEIIVEDSPESHAPTPVESPVNPPTMENNIDSDEESPVKMTVKERRAAKAKARKEAKAAAQAELERAEAERIANAKLAAKQELQTSLAKATAKRRTHDMGTAPSISDVY